MCMRKRLLGANAVVTALAGVSYVQAQTESRKPRLSIEQLIEIKHPSDPAWSPDSKHVVFTWDRADIKNLYVANADGSGLHRFPKAESPMRFGAKMGRAFISRTPETSGRFPQREAKPSRPGASRLPVTDSFPLPTASAWRSCIATAPMIKPRAKEAIS